MTPTTHEMLIVAESLGALIAADRKWGVPYCLLRRSLCIRDLSRAFWTGALYHALGVWAGNGPYR